MSLRDVCACVCLCWYVCLCCMCACVSLRPCEVVCVYACVGIFLCVHENVCMSVFLRLGMRVYDFVCDCGCVSVFAFVCVCLCGCARVTV